MILVLKIVGAVAACVAALWLLSVAWFLFCAWASGKVWRQ